VVDKNLEPEFQKDRQERDLANRGQQGKAEGFLHGKSSGGAIKDLNVSNREVDKSFFLAARSAGAPPKEPATSLELLLKEIDRRCGELLNSRRSSILNSSDTKLKILIKRLEEVVADRLGISRERLELKFVQTNDGLVLRGFLKLDGSLKLPVDLGRDGSLTFSKPFVLTERGLQPQSLTNIRFKDDSVSANLGDYAGLRNAFLAVKCVTEQTKGKEAVLAVKEENDVVYALARDQVSRSFYLYKFKAVQVDGKSLLEMSKERAKVEVLKGGDAVKVRSNSAEVVFRLGFSDVVFSSRTSETAEMLFADEQQK